MLIYVVLKQNPYKNLRNKELIFAEEVKNELQDEFLSTVGGYALVLLRIAPKPVNPTYVQKKVQLIMDLKDAEQLAWNEGIEQFKNDQIEKVGSREWKDFLIA